jgi:hypothetical protein
MSLPLELFGVNQIIAADYVEFWIGQKSKSVSSFLNHHLASFLIRITEIRIRAPGSDVQ